MYDSVLPLGNGDAVLLIPISKLREYSWYDDKMLNHTIISGDIYTSFIVCDAEAGIMVILITEWKLKPSLERLFMIKIIQWEPSTIFNIEGTFLEEIS